MDNKTIELHTIATFQGKEYELENLLNGLLNKLEEKDKEIERLSKEVTKYDEILCKRNNEVDRLNNIIDELEKCLDKNIELNYYKNGVRQYNKTLTEGAKMFRDYIKEHLKELKGENNDNN